MFRHEGEPEATAARSRAASTGELRCGAPQRDQPLGDLLFELCRHGRLFCPYGVVVAPPGARGVIVVDWKTAGNTQPHVPLEPVPRRCVPTEHGARSRDVVGTLPESTRDLSACRCTFDPQ